MSLSQFAVTLDLATAFGRGIFCHHNKDRVIFKKTPMPYDKASWPVATYEFCPAMTNSDTRGSLFGVEGEPRLAIGHPHVVQVWEETGATILFFCFVTNTIRSFDMATSQLTCHPPSV